MKSNTNQTKTSRIKKLAIIFGVVGTVGVLTGAKGNCDKNAANRANWAVERAAGKLDLTEQQKSKLVDLKDHYLKVRETYQSTKVTDLNTLLQLASAEKFSKEQATQLIESKLSIVQTEYPAFIEKLAVFHDSLDAEQKAKISKKIQKKIDKQNRNKQ